MQRKERGGSSSARKSPGGTEGALAWEIFSPVATSGLRSLAPGALKLTELGGHHANVIEVADKVAGSAEQLHSYQEQIAGLKKEAQTEREFKLKSLGKVNAHFSSIPNAVAVDGQELIGQAAEVVNVDMFTNMPEAVERLQAFAAVTEELKKLRAPYARMESALADCAQQARASFEGLGMLQSALEDLVRVAVFPAFQTWAFSESRTVGGYRNDVGTILSTIEAKRRGYENAIGAVMAMEGYLSANAGRKGVASNYRDPLSPACVARLKAAIPGVVADPDDIHQTVHPYAECTFDNIIDSLDFLPIEDSDGFFALTQGLKDAYPDRASEVVAKEARYEQGISLAIELDLVRPMLELMEEVLDPLVMNFIWQEYYHFWRDDPRSLLSHYSFSYVSQIRQMRSNVASLPAAVLSFSNFE